jgi:ferredoxin-like protein FixX
MMFQPGTGTHQDEREKLARNQNGNNVERKSLVTFCPLTTYNRINAGR